MPLNARQLSQRLLTYNLFSSCNSVMLMPLLPHCTCANWGQGVSWDPGFETDHPAVKPTHHYRASAACLCSWLVCVQECSFLCSDTEKPCLEPPPPKKTKHQSRKNIYKFAQSSHKNYKVLAGHIGVGCDPSICNVEAGSMKFISSLAYIARTYLK